MTNDEIFDTYAVAMLTGIGAKLAEAALSGGLDTSAVAAVVATAMQAARQAYDVRDTYRPDGQPT